VSLVSIAAATAAALDLSGAAAATTATVTATDTSVVTRLVDSDCIYATATPTLVGEHLLVALHKKSSKMSSRYAHCGSDPTPSGLYAVSVVTGEAWVLAEDFDAEAPGVWTGSRFWIPLVGKAGIGTWSAEGPVRLKPHNTVTDSAGYWDAARGQYVVGSVNVPLPVCQNGPSPWCGSVVAIDAQGALQHTADRTSGLRGWISGGITSDGRHYYLGTGNGEDGQNSLAGNPMRACSVVKLDGDLNVVASYDDGVEGCRDLGRLKSAVIGELPIVDGSLYVQHLGSTDGQAEAPFVRLAADDLSVQCRVGLPAAPNQAVGSFYQAPVVDEHGRAYLVSATLDNRNKAALYRVDSDCSLRLLHGASAGRAGTPTLADDRWVLYGDAGSLHVVDRETGAATDHGLGSQSTVIAGAVISKAGVSVLSTDGTVTTLKATGVTSYGDAPWPRFRADDHGRATAP